jgi:uncharacterized membrane protein
MLIASSKKVLPSTIPLSIQAINQIKQIIKSECNLQDNEINELVDRLFILKAM